MATKQITANITSCLFPGRLKNVVQRFLVGHAISAHPVNDGSPADFGFPTGFRNCYPSPGRFHKGIVAPVAILYRSRDPATVQLPALFSALFAFSARVVALVVGSINRVFRCRLPSHVLNEGIEAVGPSLTHADAPASVVVPPYACVFWIRSSLSCPMPGAVLIRKALANAGVLLGWSKGLLERLSFLKPGTDGSRVTPVGPSGSAVVDAAVRMPHNLDVLVHNLNTRALFRDSSTGRAFLNSYRNCHGR